MGPRRERGAHSLGFPAGLTWPKLRSLRLNSTATRSILIVAAELGQKSSQESLAHVHQDQLLAKINDHNAVVAIVGLGYVGLPLAVAFAEHGFPVIGIDVDARKVTSLNRGESYVQDIPSERLAGHCRWATLRPTDCRPPAPSGRRPTTPRSQHCDAAIICVPTPLNKTRDPDVRFVIAAGESVAQHIHPGMLVVLESTTYPGTTEELLLPMLTGRAIADRLHVESFEVGTDFFLAFSPERIDPGNQRLRGGEHAQGSRRRHARVPRSRGRACMERPSNTIVPISSTQAAEMVKLLENTFRAVNIALVNEVAIMCDKLGIDVWEVIEAAATKPYGFMKFTPGPGVGGHCIPLDPFYLSWKMKTLNYNARFIQLAGEINSDMPRYWVEKAVDALNERRQAAEGQPRAGAGRGVQEGHRRPARVAGAGHHRAAAQRRARMCATTTPTCRSSRTTATT